MTMAKGAFLLSLSSLILFSWVFCVCKCASLTIWMCFLCFFFLLVLPYSGLFVFILLLLSLLLYACFFLMGEIKKGCGFRWVGKWGGDRNCNQNISYKNLFSKIKKVEELFAVLKRDILNAPRGCYIGLQK